MEDAAAPTTEPAAPAAEPAFTATRGLDQFTATEVLRFEQNGRLTVIAGTLRGTLNHKGGDTFADAAGEPCLMQLELKAPFVDGPAALLAVLPAFNLTLTNHSGAEYSYYDASSSAGTYAVECIWPASARQVCT
jgi:hypothetical protein